MAFYDPQRAARAPPRPYYSLPTDQDELRAFDPKAVSRPRPKTPPKIRTAPYVSLNSLDYHYNPADALAEARKDEEVVFPVTRTALKRARIASAILRIPQLLGAAGILCGMLFVKNIDTTTGWICRLPAGVAILHVLYNMYHVSGNYRMRTPKSASTYHVLASTLDAVLVGYYLFLVVVVWQQHALSQLTWTTVFGDSITAGLVLGVFITGCISGFFTLCSIGIAAYLIRCFRILQELPVDANPFFNWDDAITRKPIKSPPTVPCGTPPEELSEKERMRRWSVATGAPANSLTPLIAEITTHEPWEWSEHANKIVPSAPASPTQMSSASTHRRMRSSISQIAWPEDSDVPTSPTNTQYRHMRSSVSQIAWPEDSDVPTSPTHSHRHMRPSLEYSRPTSPTSFVTRAGRTVPSRPTSPASVRPLSSHRSSIVSYRYAVLAGGDAREQLVPYTRALRRNSQTVTDEPEAASVGKPARKGFRIRAPSFGEESRYRGSLDIGSIRESDDGDVGVREDEGYQSMNRAFMDGLGVHEKEGSMPSGVGQRWRAQRERSAVV